MNIYLAGGITGNLIKDWKKLMELYFASGGQGQGGLPCKQKDIPLDHLYILESYHYIVKQQWMYPLIKQFKGFLLDSGAFTFMTSMKGESIDWDQYIINYGKFVKELDIEYFFELDIDSIVGIKEVERLRALLEKTAGRQCIPVWHKSRGLDYWKKMCMEYDYVSIGGIVTQEIKRSEYEVFYPLLKIAKENNCLVHALGFTNLKGMEKYRFHSVDSTSWLSGNKFGAVYFFTGKTMAKVTKKVGQRVKTNEVAHHNFNEWYKFSEYAQSNL